MTVQETFQALSAPELIAYCAKNNDANDAMAWKEFVRRYHNRILGYVIHEYRHSYGLTSVDKDAVCDLVQDVYLRLLANDRTALREFRGSNEPSLLAYLACITHSVVSDQARRETSKKRGAPTLSLDQRDDGDKQKRTIADKFEAGENSSPDRRLNEKLTSQELRALLKSVLDGSNAKRDAIIFQLHALEDLSASEIARLPAFGMTTVAVTAVIRRTRERLRNVLDSPDSAELSI